MQQTKAKECKFLDMFIICYPGRLLGHKGQGNGLTCGPKYLTRVKHSELQRQPYLISFSWLLTAY